MQTAFNPEPFLRRLKVKCRSSLAAAPAGTIQGLAGFAEEHDPVSPFDRSMLRTVCAGHFDLKRAA